MKLVIKTISKNKSVAYTLKNNKLRKEDVFGTNQKMSSFSSIHIFHESIDNPHFISRPCPTASRHVTSRHACWFLDLSAPERMHAE